jgi:mannose-1-phosphate guanylyltransferase
LDNYIIEPGQRDTAAAIGLAAIAIREKDPDAIMAVVTADHFIDHVDKFLQTLRAAKQAAKAGYLVTLGIHPTFPSTGFGYIQQGDYLGTYENVVVFRAISFKEKPDQQTARTFLEAEDHSWNSGMFIWQIERILNEIERQMPELHKALKDIKQATGSDKYEEVLSKAWAGLSKISVDFGIMEGAADVAVIPTKGLGWSDVGSWNALFEVLEADERGNIVHCEEHIDIGSRGSMVFANGRSQRLIVTIGLEDMTVVDTGDVLLVCSKERAQDVRQIVAMLREQGKTEYL